MVMSTASQGPSGGTLTEVLELILDRGVVIDAFVRVSLVGIEVLTTDARVVVASRWARSRRVRRDRRAALDDAVGQLGRALEDYLALRYIGPLPPYSFSELSLETGEE